MPTTFNFKDVIDLPSWRPVAISLSANTAGVCLTNDPRNNEDRDPHVYQFASATSLQKYNFKNDAWIHLASPAMSGTFGAGSGCCFVASSGPFGQLSAGWTNTRGALLSALPASVAINQLANRGDNTLSFKVRIIGTSVGRTEERYIVANSSGTNPVIHLDTALSFTPLSTDRYEILSGRVYMLNAGTLAAGSWKSYDIATNTYITLNQTNLPATVGTDTCFAVLDELSTPIDKDPGDGLFGILSASGATSSGLSGRSAALDSNLLSNQYLNYQIRIVNDPVSAASVGQRRRILGHTTSTSPTFYTLAAPWTVVPSASSTYVIEYNGDILCWTSAASSTFAYAGGGFRPDFSWSTSTTSSNGVSGITAPARYTARPVAIGAGCSSWIPYGVITDQLSVLSASFGFRPSYVYTIRGGGASTIEYMDVATGALTATVGTWFTVSYGNSGTALFGTGTSLAYDPVTIGGKYAYINLNGTNFMYRYDTKNNILEPWQAIRYTQGTAVVGNKLATTLFVDGSARMGAILLGRQSLQEYFQCFNQR